MAERSASARAGRAAERETDLAGQRQEAPSGARCAAALAVDPDLLPVAQTAAPRAVAAGASPASLVAFAVASPDAWAPPP